MPRHMLLCAVLLAFWLAGCAAMPAADGDLVRISRDGKRCVESKDRPDAVIDICNRAIAQGGALSDDAMAMVLGRRGFAYMQQGRLGDARRDFDFSVKLVPGQVDAHLGRAMLSMRERKPDAAILDYDRAIAAMPGSVALLLMRSAAHQATGAAEKARLDVDRALLLEPRNAAALTSRGTMRRLSGDLDGAISDLDLALAEDAGQRDALESRGHIRFLRGDYAAAAADYLGAIDPASAAVDRSLWLFVARARIADPAARDELARRPAPKPTARDLHAMIVAMILGQMSADEVQAAIHDPDPRIERERECTALFFAAEFHLWRGEKEMAAVLFRRAITTGATHTATHAAADAELKRIDQIPVPPKRAEPAAEGQSI